MATRTQKYLEYLDQQNPIAPANSQEELQTAQSIEAFFKSRGLETQVQDVDASTAAPRIRAILQIIICIGMFVAHFGGAAISTLFMLITLAAVVLLVLDTLGKDVLSRWTPIAKSQNVIAVHRASGPLVSKGKRPIVIVAHYDTPYENVLYRLPFARVQMYVRIAAVWSIPFIALCVIFQPFAALGGFRTLLWIVGFIASLAPLCVGVATIAEHFMGCTTGANDNKSSIAALFDIASTVRPAENEQVPAQASDQVSEQASAFGNQDATSEASSVPASDDHAENTNVADETTDLATNAADKTNQLKPLAELQYEQVVGVRHGEEVIRSLGMLSEECELEYLEPRLITPTAAPASQTREFDQASDDVTNESGEACAPSFGPRVFAPLSAVGRRGGARAAQGATEPTDQFASLVRHTQRRVQGWFKTTSHAAHDLFNHFSASHAKQNHDADLEQAKDAPFNESVYKESQQQASAAVPASAPAPEGYTFKDVVAASTKGNKNSVDDKTAAVSQASKLPDLSDNEQLNLARRVSLFDLPDPSKAEVDPLSPEGIIHEHPMVDERTAAVQQSRNTSTTPTTYDRSKVPSVQKLDADPLQAPASMPAQKKLRLFGKKKQQQDSFANFLGVDNDFDAKVDGGKIGSWDNFDSTDSTDALKQGRGQTSNPENSWKGGATINSKLQVIDGDAPAATNELAPSAATSVDQTPSSEDVRDAVLAMTDDRLTCHDIWFVALGASALDRAGMQSFLQDFRRTCRGSFVINLDSIGAGQLTVLGHEGIYNKRRADRRLTRMLINVAKDLHIPLEKRNHAWTDTDVTAAMRSSMRSITITGLDENALPALSHTADDVIDMIDVSQIKNVSTLICELIRRS